MNVIVVLEHRFNRTPDGAIWTQTAFAYPFWTRYLEVFEHVQVIARVKDVLSLSSDWKRADGNNVTFADIPYYLGPWQYLQQSRQVKQAAIAAISPTDAVILRVSSQLAACVEPMLRRTQHPYAVEVVGDPYDTFAPGAVHHPLRPFFRWWFPRQLRRQCAGACAAAYVTEAALQKRYPPGTKTFAAGCSDVELPPEAFVKTSRSIDPYSRCLTLIHVGTLAQLYKAPDVLIGAAALAVHQGLDLQLIMIGDGQYRSWLEARARDFGIADRVIFRGQLPAGDAIRQELDQADVFVLPSRQEGLPRAMVEAMARGLPCIGSTVGGIPELLPPEDLVMPGDLIELTNKIIDIATSPIRRAQMSARNLVKAQEYSEATLHKRRLAFYQVVREKTQVWLNTQIGNTKEFQTLLNSQVN